MAAENWEMATADFRKALEREPRNKKYFTYLVRTLFLAERYDEAVKGEEAEPVLRPYILLAKL